MDRERVLLLSQVGMLCSDWSLLESYLEGIIWWELNITPEYGRLITGPMDIERRSRLARDLVGLRTADEADMRSLTLLACYVDATKDLRNLAVHGARLRIGDKTHGIVSKGKWKYTPTPIHLDEMGKLLEASHYMVDFASNILFRLGLINSGPKALLETLPLLLQPCHLPQDQTPLKPLPPPELSQA